MGINYELTRHFYDAFLSLLGSMNKYRIPRLSQETTYNGFFNLELGFRNEIHSYILGDKGYFLLPWLMIPHKHSANNQHTNLEDVYNC